MKQKEQKLAQTYADEGGQRMKSIGMIVKAAIELEKTLAEGLVEERPAEDVVEEIAEDKLAKEILFFEVLRTQPHLSDAYETLEPGAARKDFRKQIEKAFVSQP